MRMLIAAGASLAMLLASVAAAEQAALKPFVFLYRPGPGWKAGEPMSRQGLGPHTLYIKSLHGKGRIYAAGSLGAERGLAIVGAADIEDARAVLAADPAITAGIFVADVEPFGQRYRGEGPIPLAVN